MKGHCHSEAGINETNPPSPADEWRIHARVLRSQSGQRHRAEMTKHMANSPSVSTTIGGAH
jgi:hypothetical protein